MFLRVMRLTEKITGALLGSAAVSLLAGNILVCLVIIFGPAGFGRTLS